MKGSDMAKTVEWSVESCGLNPNGKPVFGFLSFTTVAVDDELMHPDSPPEQLINALTKAAEVMGITDLQIIDAKTSDSVLNKACKDARRPILI